MADTTVWHDAVDRGVDFGVVEVFGCLYPVGFGFVVSCFGQLVVFGGCLEIIVADQIALMEFAVAFIVRGRVCKRCACALHIGLGRFKFALEQHFLDFGYELSLFYLRVEIHIYFVYDACHLSAHIDRRDGFQGACRSD